MKDPLGTNRGACSKCSCKEYRIEAKAVRPTCWYCECPAPAHAELPDDGSSVLPFNVPSSAVLMSPSGVSVPTMSSSPMTSPNASLLSSSSSESGTIIVEVASDQEAIINSLLNSRPQQNDHEPTSDEIDALLPKRFSKKIERALQTKSVDANHKSAIVRKVVDNLSEKGKDSPSCLKKAAKKMTQRWSPFKNPFSNDPENKALYEKLQRRKNRLNLLSENHGNNDDSTEPTSTTPADAKEKMKRDYAAGVRNPGAFRENMKLTRMIRAEEAKSKAGLLLLKEYPGLTIMELVLEEFESEMEVTKATMVANWERAIPNIIDYYIELKIPCVTYGTSSEKTMSILENLHLVPLWKRKETTRISFILETFPENTLLDEMRPKAKDPPRLIAQGNVLDSTLSIQCYLDTEPFFVEKDPLESMLLLLSAYFLLGVKWNSQTRLQILFLCCCTAGPKKLAPYISRNPKFLDLLKKLKIF